MMGGFSSATMRAIFTVSKFLSKLSIVTAVADVVLSICLDIYESVLYTEEIAKYIPLSLEEKAAIGFDHSFFGFLKPGEKDIEAENNVRVKEYLTLLKNQQINKFFDEKIVATAHFIDSIRETPSYKCLIGCYSEFLLSSIRTTTYSLNGLNPIPLTLYNLNNTDVYLDISRKHIPHLSQNEYNDGLRIVSAPNSFTCKQKAQSSSIGDFLFSYKDFCSYIFNERTNLESDYIRTYKFSGEPLVFINNTRLNGSIFYSSVPRYFIADKNYQAIINLPTGIGQINQIGSENHQTTYILDDKKNRYTHHGRLKGGVGQKNTFILNLNVPNITFYIDLHGQKISSNFNGTSYTHFFLENLYNFIGSNTCDFKVVTDCKTRYISVNSDRKSYVEQYQRGLCHSADSEVREVNKNNVHVRGLKQTTFIVDQNSNGSKILLDLDKRISSIRSKNNIDIVKIRAEDKTINDACSSSQNIESGNKIHSLKLQGGEGMYYLHLLGDIGTIEEYYSNPKIIILFRELLLPLR